jgi:hypothetical protein
MIGFGLFYQLDRWNELKEVLRIQAHAEAAKTTLLDR